MTVTVSNPGLVPSTPKATRPTAAALRRVSPDGSAIIFTSSAPRDIE